MNAHTSSPRVWSPQQAAFIDFAVNGHGSCVLEAVAGAGKTTTLLEAARRMSGTVAILAYNKKIADEISGKLKAMGIDWKKANAGTVHSFGFKALTKSFNLGRNAVNGMKVADILDRLLPPEHDLAQKKSMIAQLVSLAKQRAIGVIQQIDDVSAWIDIIEHFDLLNSGFGDFEPAEHDIEQIVRYGQRALKASNQDTNIIDYDDMVYLPLVHRLRMFQYDTVIIDEAQDTNPARRALVRALVRRGGRVFAVGDQHQAIYGFTGADNDSLALIARDFNAKKLPLTVTYRCPKAVVEVARQWVNHITAHESAPEGRYYSEDFETFAKRNDLNGSAAVLCRVTKPLVALAFALIRQKIACRIEGRAIGQNLIKLATRWKAIKTLSALEAKLEDYLGRETTKLLAAKREAKLQEVEDQVETLLTIIETCRAEKKDTIVDLKLAIESLFADDVSGMLTLSTIHKSKGREWPRVFWLDRINTCPSKWARQDWMQEQERNLMYVAATRAQEELIELAPPPKREKGAAK